MNKSLILLIFLASAAFMAFGQDNAKQVIEKSRDVSKIDGYESVTTLLIIHNKGNQRIRKTTMASRTFDNGMVEKRIVKFISPADIKGTGILIFDYDDKTDEMWLYMPSLRKSRRIVSDERSDNFMGSEFTNADMASPSLDEFTFSMLGSETVDGTDCYKIEQIPVTEQIAEDLGVSRKIVYIGKTDYMLRKSTIFDLDREPLKTITVNDIKMIDTQKKKYMATKMTVENLQNGRKSVMTMEQVKHNPNVPDNYFTVNYLEAN